MLFRSFAIYNKDAEHQHRQFNIERVTKIMSSFWLLVIGKVYGVAEVGAWMIERI